MIIFYYKHLYNNLVSQNCLFCLRQNNCLNQEIGPVYQLQILSLSPRFLSDEIACSNKNDFKSYAIRIQLIS